MALFIVPEVCSRCGSKIQPNEVVQVSTIGRTWVSRWEERLRVNILPDQNRTVICEQCRKGEH